MKQKIFLIALIGGIALAGCANTGAQYQPIADGPVSANYYADLNTCQHVASQRSYMNDDTKTNAAIGAGLGMLAGLADNSVNDTEGAIAGALVGALAGGGSGMLDTREQRRQIVIACMKGRGHPVVG